MTQSVKRKKNKNGENQKTWNRTTITVAIIGWAAVVITILTVLASKLPIMTQSAKETPIPSDVSSVSLIFSDTFDDNDADWFVDQTERDFNSSGLRATTYIENGKYHRTVESNESFTHAYSVLPIPNISIDNFCLVFDARVHDSPQDAAIVVIARATAWESYYYIGFNTNGEGHVRLADRQIAKWESGIPWNDEKTHTAKISFQNSDLEIYDDQTNTLLFKTRLTENDFLPDIGDMRIGLELLNPNQKATAEIDNVSIYNQCP